MKKIIATVLLVCVVVSGIVFICFGEKSDFTSIIPGLNATMDMVQDLTHVHKLQLVGQVDPTCDDAGTKAYYACDGCEELFADEKGEMVITAPDLIERLSHEYDDEYDADCNLCGAVRVAKCRHASTKILAAKAENCTESGLTKGEECLDCGEMIVSQQIIPATGHSYDNDEDVSCNNCGYERCLHTNTEAVGAATESTCSVHGMTAGEKCSDCGEILVAQEKLPLADHTEVATDAVAAGCITSGHTAGSKCSVCDTVIKKPETVAATGHKWEGIGCTTCGAVKFEAEDSVLVTDIERAGQGLQSNKTLEQANYPSGDGYVYYLSDDGNATLTFTVNSSKAGKAVLSFRMGLTKYEYTASKLFTFTVNNKECEYYSSAVFPTYEEAGVIIYFGWYEVEVAEIDLVEGNNTIVLTRNTNGMNFDYIALRSTDGATIGTSDCSKVGHSYGAWTVSVEPTYEAAGEIKKICSACSDVQTATLPVVSLDNKYTKVGSDSFTTDWEYTYDGQKFSFTVEDVKTSVYEFTIADNDPFDAANGGSVVKGTVDGSQEVGKTTNKYGTFYELNKGATFTLTINVEEATDIAFIIKVCSTNNYSFDYSKAITAISSKNSSGSENEIVVNSGTVNTVGWYTSTASAIEIATISLAEGTNTITFTMGTETAKTLNIASIAFESAIPVSLGAKE